MVSLDPIVGVPRCVVERERQKFADGSSQGWRAVGGDFTRRAVDTYGTGEEPGGCQRVAFLGNEHVDDVAVVVNGSIDVSPGPRHLPLCLVEEPTAADAVAARLGASTRIGVDRWTQRNNVT